MGIETRNSYSELERFVDELESNEHDDATLSDSSDDSRANQLLFASLLGSPVRRAAFPVETDLQVGPWVPSPSAIDPDDPHRSTLDGNDIQHLLSQAGGPHSPNAFDDLFSVPQDVELRVFICQPDGIYPSKRWGAPGWDLFVRNNFRYVLYAGKYVPVPLGLTFQIPEGYVAHVVPLPRYMKDTNTLGLAVEPAVIEEGKMLGQLRVLVRNTRSNRPIHIYGGMPVAQIVLVKCATEVALKHMTPEFAF
jgi:dUTPase